MDKYDGENVYDIDIFKDFLFVVDCRSIYFWSSLFLSFLEEGGSYIERFIFGGEWGDMLDYFFRRKIRVFVFEYFENMWLKGRNYYNKDI